MLYKTLTNFTQLLNNNLKLFFKLTENIAFLCPIKESGKASSNNRVGISLVNIERETNGGINFNYQTIGNKYSRKTPPPWQLNLYVLISVIFSEKQYAESLQIMSGILSFLQKNNLFEVQGSGPAFTIEPVNLSFNEQSNLWSILGGNYYPSILCKIRMLTIDEQEIINLSTVIGKAVQTSNLEY